MAVTLRPGEVFEFTASVVPEQELTFASRDPSVADVLYGGSTVVANGVGKTEIVVSAGDHYEVIGIYVIVEETTLRVDPDYMHIDVGETKGFNVTVTPEQEVSVISLDPSIATITEEGEVLGVSDGYTELVFTAGDATKNVLVRVHDVGETEEDDIDEDLDDEDYNYIDTMVATIKAAVNDLGMPVFESPTVEFVYRTTWGQYRFRIIGDGSADWADNWTILHVLNDAVVSVLGGFNSGWFIENGGNEVIIAVQ